MRVRVNDQDTEVRDGATITELLVQLGLSSSRVAIEINTHLVRRADHATTVLHHEDRIEIVALVGGG